MHGRRLSSYEEPTTKPIPTPRIPPIAPVQNLSRILRLSQIAERCEQPPTSPRAPCPSKAKTWRSPGDRESLNPQVLGHAPGQKSPAAGNPSYPRSRHRNRADSPSHFQPATAPDRRLSETGDGASLLSVGAGPGDPGKTPHLQGLVAGARSEPATRALGRIASDERERAWPHRGKSHGGPRRTYRVDINNLYIGVRLLTSTCGTSRSEGYRDQR